MPKAPEPSSTCQKTTKSLPRISPKSYCYNAVPNRFLAHFSTSRTNGPRLLSRAKVGTHSALLKGSHTAAYTPKQGAFRMGLVSLLSEHSARSPTSPGRVSERHTLPLLSLGRGALPKNAESLRDSDALMRVAVPRRRGPAGLRDPIAVSLAALMGFTVLLSRFVGTQKIERLFFSYSGAFFEPLFASIHARNLSFGTTIRLPILSAGNSLPCTNS